MARAHGDGHGGGDQAGPGGEQAGPGGDQAGPGGTPPAPEPVAELLDDRVIRLGGGSAGRRLATSIPGALGATFLVVAIAFGAGLASGLAAGPADLPVAGDPLTTATAPASEGGDATPAKPTWFEPTASPEASWLEPSVPPTAEPTVFDPTPKPTDKPVPTKPPVTSPVLWLGSYGGSPVAEWSACTGADFDYYKVVRSTDAGVSWPLGPNDELIGVIGPNENRRVQDDAAPRGIALAYRVFCVRWTDAGYLVLAASNTKTVTPPPGPSPTPPPDPVTIGLDTAVTDGGAVMLTWDACPADGYAYTKVLRSTTTSNPSYLPWTDGTEIMAVLSDPNATQWPDTAAVSGVTVWYRVQCIGSWNGQKVLLGQSAVVAFALP